MSSTSSAQYNEAVNGVRIAISAQDSSQVETLIKDLDAAKLRELLSSKYGEKTLLEYVRYFGYEITLIKFQAFTAGSTTIGFFLLAKSQQKNLNQLPFSLYHLFGNYSHLNNVPE